MPSEATTKPQTSSTWTFTCRHHRNLRWTKNKCGGGFIGRGVLMFQGDLTTGKPGPFAFVQSESSLKKKPKKYQREYRERFAVECDCPISDLIVVRKHHIPFPGSLA